MEIAEDGACSAGTEQAAARDLAAARAEIDQAQHDLKNHPEHVLADTEAAERDLEKARAEIKEGEEHRKHFVEVTVDRVRKRVEAGTYVVSVFKEKVGVAADRELDELRAGVFEPLDDGAKIIICGHEVFVSHVRTGGSS